MTEEFTGRALTGARFERVDLTGASFRLVDLVDARFRAVDLSGAVIRAAEVRGVEIDAPWLSDGDTFFRVNDVDVIPLVEAELDRRFPGRSERRAQDPDGLRSAWAALERTWAATIERVAAMPAGTVDESVGGEWSFAQTLRHLVFATDMWLGKAVLRLDEPFHPLGQLDDGTRGDEHTAAGFRSEATFDEVLQARASRVAMVRDVLARVTPAELDEPRANPHDPAHPEWVRSCLHVILEEEWEHHRFAVRDLAALQARTTA